MIDGETLEHEITSARLSAGRRLYLAARAFERADDHFRFGAGTEEKRLTRLSQLRREIAAYEAACGEPQQ